MIPGVTAMQRTCLFLVLGLVLSFAAASAQEIEYEKYELENGLTVILHEDHSLPVVCVNTWYHVGGKDETEGRSGFAHLFEHLMFMGTERVPGNEFDEIMEAGGGWNNASTSWDRTNYFSFGPKSLLPTLLWLDADRMEDFGRMMDQEKLDKQREVVLNERREMIELEPYGRAEFEISRLMYPPDHPYHIGVIGTVEEIRAASVQDVKDFFAAFYVPNNASLVVAGDFDPKEVKPLVAKMFGTIPRGADPVHAKAEPQVLAGTKRVTYSDQVQSGRLYMVWHSPPFFREGDAEMDLVAQVLSAGKSSRLYKRLVHEEKIASNVAAYQSSGSLGSLFHVIITARQGYSLDEIERVADEVIREFVREGPEKKELERQVASLEFGMLRSLQSVLRKANRMNMFEYYYDEPNSFRRDLDRYRKASTRSVRDWARKVLLPDGKLVVKVLPEEESGFLAGRDERPVPGVAGAFQVPEPETFVLSSGIEVDHWRRSELPLVEVALLLRAGSAQMDAELAGCSRLTAEMLDEGTGDLDAFEFSDALDLLGARMTARPGTESSRLGLSVLKRNLGEALRLAGGAVMEPRFDREDWDRVKSLHIEHLRQMEDRPAAVAGLVGMRAFFGDDHPYGKPVNGTIESVDSITLEKVMEAHRRHYAPGNAKFFIAGDLTTEEAKEALEDIFGVWKNPAGFEPAPPVAKKIAANQDLRVILVEKPDAVQTVIRFYMSGPLFSDPNRIGLELLNTILGGSFTSRLNSNLREEHGYTYGAGSRFVMTPSTGYLVAYSTVQAEVTGSALGEFLHEFRRIREGDVTAEEAKKARESNRMDTIQSFEGLGGILATASHLDFHGLSFSSLGEDLVLMASIDEEELNALAGPAVLLEEALIVLVGDRSTILEQLDGLGLPEPEEWTVKGEPKR